MYKARCKLNVNPAGVVLFVSLSLLSSTELSVFAVDRSDTACPTFLIIFSGCNRTLIDTLCMSLSSLMLSRLSECDSILDG